MRDAALPGGLVLLVGLAAAAAALVVHADEPAPISWEEAGKHVGEQVVVDGRVMGIHCSRLSCLLAFEPTFNRFTAVIQAAQFGTYPPEQLDRKFTGRRVRVRGTVKTVDEKPEIEVQSAGDLTLLDVEEQRAEQVVQMAETQTQILERLDAVLANIEDLTERLATTQERVETMLAQLEQRSALLAAAAAPPPAAGPALPPSAQVPPRPASQALRTVKRGMTADTVRRLLGEPSVVEPAVNGGEVWHYGYGQSVSFDGRGRAQSTSGLTPP